MPKRSKSMQHALDLQSIAMQAARTVSADLQSTVDKELRTKQAQALSAIIRAHDTVEERKRILKGQPMPGSLRPDAQPKKRKTYRASNVPIEVVEFSEPSKESLLPANPEEAGGQGGLSEAVK